VKDSPEGQREQMGNGEKEPVVIATFDRVGLAHIARIALEQEGIEVFMTQDFDAIFGMFGKGELRVYPADVELAREILQRPRRSSPPPGQQ